MDIYLVIFITLIAALIASFAQILFKRGMAKSLSGLREVLALFKRRNVLAGIGAYVVSLVIYLYALKSAPLSLVYPIFASSFVFTALFSSVFLKEKINAVRAAGVLLVFVGVAIIGITA
ncbi:MAG: EamA family transporter [Candidatus Micrarchaeia archaeon]